MSSTSKKVFIRRLPSYLEAVQTGAREFMSLSRQSVGPYFAGNTGRQIGTGLSYDEIDFLMPHLVDASPDDRQFREKVREFFSGLLTHVDYGGIGREFEIGLSKSNEEPLSRTNMPLDIADYVRYRHAKSHPSVAASLEDGKGHVLKMFYIYDPAAAEATAELVAEDRDEALTIYMTIKDDEEKVNQYLLLLKTDPRDFRSAAQRRTKLRELSEQRTAEFIKISKVDNFELRFKVEALISVNILELVGERVYETRTKTLVANNVEEAVKLLQSDEYNERLMQWMSAYQDIAAKPKEVIRRKVGV